MRAHRLRFSVLKRSRLAATRCLPPARLASPASFALVLLPLVLLEGCGASLDVPPAIAHPAPISIPALPPPPLTLTPATATLQAWQTVEFTLTGAVNPASCAWSTSSASVLAPVASSTGQGEFQGQQAGSATVSVVCGEQNGQATVTVVPQPVSGPIVITEGGTYSGNWNSNDPGTAAVTIATNQPVIIQDSVLTGRGTLILVSPSVSGAQLTVRNVTGTALDPGIEGLQRGAFVNASYVRSLVIEHCTMTGVSFGLYSDGGAVSTLRVLNNLALNLEDRASDGEGGLLAARPDLGHFIILANIAAAQGAEIGWNKVVQTMGQSSVEDVINIYRSQGAPGAPIWVHDNYIEGNSSPSAPTNYNGTGIITDGGKTGPVTALALFADNDIVHTAGTGIALDSGHDVTASGNRIVSCGQDAAGVWYAMPYAEAASIWDGYNAGPALFYNNKVTDSAGGLVRPNAAGEPVAADFFGYPLSMSYPGNAASDNNFTDPCLATYAATGSLDLAAEDAERAWWTAKAAGAGELIGDQH